ncbi:MAG: DUF4982 domain-containing protein [Blautia sp.]|nr:DUF4982 domain-containing protein [Blautia sp.]
MPAQAHTWRRTVIDGRALDYNNVQKGNDMRLEWNDGWSFVKLSYGSSYDSMKAAEKRRVFLPHDWMIEDADHFYEDADGWYVKSFENREEWQGKTLILCFDGVYMDAEILLDGKVLGIHRYGYTAFQIRLPDALTPGMHEIAVHVRSRNPNSRWYAGAGIYRDVTLLILPQVHLVPDGIRTATRREKDGWMLDISAEVKKEAGGKDPEEQYRLTAVLLDQDGAALSSAAAFCDFQGCDTCTVSCSVYAGKIRPWSVTDPSLYPLALWLEETENPEKKECAGASECAPETDGAENVQGRRGSRRPGSENLTAAAGRNSGKEFPCSDNDLLRLNIGFRTTEFTTDKGFFLNGEHIKLHGVCLHHDLGALGAAFYEKAAERQLLLMKEMGANAVRTSHNPPARKFLDLCDRLGFLVVDELLDMWELPKTTYDNARFFPETWREDVASWVRRDRTHACVILWSIGNEIADMNVSEKGKEWTRLLMEEVRRHDRTQAQVTFGSNYMPWEGAQGCAEVIKLPGYNYGEKYYQQHHEAHPDWVIYGSETGSLLQSRGIYHFPMEEGILSDEDLQCSALLNSRTSWGTQDLRRMLLQDLETPWSLGQFIWSGTDYIGEPTPYHTRSCYFGQADTAGFPKDSYYFYQSMWTERPMLHIGCYWDWNEGQLIDVPVMTNQAEAELFLNGRSLGRKTCSRRSPEECLPVWKVPYEKGTLLARAYDEEGRLVCEEEARSFGEGKTICLSVKEESLTAGSHDMAFITVTVKDEEGRQVENAVDRIHVKVAGPGVLLGMDNGDSTDADGYQVTSRRLFSGKLLLIVGAKEEEGTICVQAEGKGLKSAQVQIPVLKKAASCRDFEERFTISCREVSAQDPERTFVRRIDLKALDGALLTPEHPSARFAVRVLPERAEDPEGLTFRILNSKGVEVPIAEGVYSPEEGIFTVTAKGDGAFYLRAGARNGYPFCRTLSSLELTAKGFGSAVLDPYHFISASLYSDSEGEVTAGNEHGVSFSRDGFSAVGFPDIDFGKAGSDEITIPVFSLDSESCEISVWEERPRREGKPLAVLPYQKEMIWNVYQEETWRLPKVLTGVRRLWFSMEKKVHMKGFSFTRKSRADRWNPAVQADEIYGDRYVKSDDAVREIGNNVTLVFEEMEFDTDKEAVLTLEGATDLATQSVTLVVRGEDGSIVKSMCPFARSLEPSKQQFPVEILKGKCIVEFVFLPGSHFDFCGFQIQSCVF